MYLVTASQMRDLDRRAIHDLGIRGQDLMYRAGLGVADLVRRIVLATDAADLPIVILCGPGNNGGDGFVAAMELDSWGFSVQIRLAAAPERVRGDAAYFFDQLPPEMTEIWNEPSRWDSDSPRFYPRGTVFVDALLGTGASGSPDGAIAGAIRWLQRAELIGPIIAVDLPSGVEADSGLCHDPHVVADATACLAMPKTCLLNPAARAACGRVEIIPIGFPPELQPDTIHSQIEWIAEEELHFPARPHTAHKGDFGRVVITGGSSGYSGAAILACRGALRSGVGLVSALVPGHCCQLIASAIPEVMVWPHGSRDSTQFNIADFNPEIENLLTEDTVLVVGPGLSQRPGTAEFLWELLEKAQAAVVMDADALNLVAAHRKHDKLQELSARLELVLTPHPGEAARLLDCSVKSVQSDRQAALGSLVKRTGATVILKGAGTMVGAPGMKSQMLLAGNPGMATGGSGDVLAGITGGLLAQGLASFEAVRLSVWWHSAAGDLAAWRNSREALTAGDIVDCLGTVSRWLDLR